MTTPDETSDGPSATTATMSAAESIVSLPTRPAPRRGPALIFLGVVALISIGGLALAGLTTGPKSTSSELGALSGTPILATSAEVALSRIAVSGNPPADVRSALVLPERASILVVTKHPENIELYSGKLTIAAPYTARALVNFYRLELAHRGWRVNRTDATANGRGTAIFATFPSSDGFYWEVETLVEPGSSTFSAALGGGSVEASSHVELQLLELNDQD